MAEHSGDPFKGEGAEFRQPRKTVKEGSFVREVPLTPPPRDDEFMLDELLRGVNASDMRSGSTGFARFVASQGGGQSSFAHNDHGAEEYNRRGGGTSDSLRGPTQPGNMGNFSDDDSPEESSQWSNPTDPVETAPRRRGTYNERDSLGNGRSPGSAAFPYEERQTPTPKQDERPFFTGSKAANLLADIDNLFDE